MNKFSLSASPPTSDTLSWEQSLVKQNFCWIPARFEGNFPSLLDPRRLRKGTALCSALFITAGIPLERFWTVKIFPVTETCSQATGSQTKPWQGWDERKSHAKKKKQFHLFPRVLSFSKLQHKQCQS